MMMPSQKLWMLSPSSTRPAAAAGLLRCRSGGDGGGRRPRGGAPWRYSSAFSSRKKNSRPPSSVANRRCAPASLSNASGSTCSSAVPSSTPADRLTRWLHQATVAPPRSALAATTTDSTPPASVARRSIAERASCEQTKTAPEGAVAGRGDRLQATPLALNQARQRFQPSSAASLSIARPVVGVEARAARRDRRRSRSSSPPRCPGPARPSSARRCRAGCRCRRRRRGRAPGR